MRAKRCHKSTCRCKLTPFKSKRYVSPRLSKIVALGNWLLGNTGNVKDYPPQVVGYKALCKSRKCYIHNSTRRPEKKSEDRPRAMGYLPEIMSMRKCRVREFEESKENLIQINPKMFRIIESMMSNISADEITIQNYLAHGFIKEAITKSVIWPFKKPKIFKGLRAAPTGILLFGPPGVGKSAVGKFIAFQTQASFFNVPASVLSSQLAEDNNDFVKAVFLVAKARQPSIIFIDEVESLLSHKSLYESALNRKVKKELFFCMDLVDRNAKDRILIIAATKRPFDLDNDIILRFSKRFYICLPDKTARKNLLEKLLECECHSLEKSDIEALANTTDGYTAGEIKLISREAAMNPVMALPSKNFINLELTAIKPVSFDDFSLALRMVKPSISKEELHFYEKWDSEHGFGGQTRVKWGTFSTSKNFEEQSTYII